jgi:hypothetical protein
MQDRPVLASIQMPPLPLRLMVVLPTRFPALRAGPLLNLVVFQMNVNFPIAQLQFHSFDEPGCLDSQNLGVQLSVLHRRSFSHAGPPAFPLQSQNPPYFCSSNKIAMFWSVPKAVGVSPTGALLQLRFLRDGLDCNVISGRSSGEESGRKRSRFWNEADRGNHSEQRP